MQSAFNTIANFAPEITSVMHGEHAKDSAHYAGRAVDVGAFAGVPVGMNKETWDALTAAIGSHRFEKIGTMAELANNPELQAYAKQNGVELFLDPGSGPHVHLQVAE